MNALQLLLRNSYLSPKVSTYLSRLHAEIDRTFSGGSIQVMQSSGGIIAAEIAAEEPVRTVLSGPAGGVIGAYHLGRLAGFDKTHWLRHGRYVDRCFL